MAYRVVYLKRAQDVLDVMSPGDRDTVKDRVRSFAQNPQASKTAQRNFLTGSWLLTVPGVAKATCTIVDEIDAVVTVKVVARV